MIIPWCDHRTASWLSPIGSLRWGLRLACRCHAVSGGGLFELRFALGPTARRIIYRFTKDGRIILLTTFRKQRNNERSEITRARKAATACAKRYP